MSFNLGITDEIERFAMRMKRAGLLTTLSLAMLATGCGSYSSFGFPVEAGNIAAGRQAFIDQRCQRCHTVAGVPMPEIAGAAPVRVELGGATSQVKAYSELVTSIINPSHRISDQLSEQVPRPLVTEMPMEHIDTMTVRQLIDIVAFLDSRYVLIDDYEYDFVADYEENF
jgi:sulfur-oxidizing protein SoxX